MLDLDMRLSQCILRHATIVTVAMMSQY